jgi:hypothetical protein
VFFGARDAAQAGVGSGSDFTQRRQGAKDQAQAFGMFASLFEFASLRESVL